MAEAKDASEAELSLTTLPMELIIAIARRMSTTEIARMMAVSKAWKVIAEHVEVRQAAFMNTWSLQALKEEPQHSNFYLTAALMHFVVKVSLGPKASVASLLVGYKTDAVTLRIINNCASDFALQCRPHIYVPVPSKDMLHGKVGTFHFDSACRRQFVVLRETDAVGTDPDATDIPKTVNDLARSRATRQPPNTIWSAETQNLTDRQKEVLLKKLTKQLSRGLSIDDGTAAYYLQLSGGDLKTAIQKYKEDEEWEDQFPVGILPLRESDPILEGVATES